MRSARSKKIAQLLKISPTKQDTMENKSLDGKNVKLQADTQKIRETVRGQKHIPHGCASNGTQTAIRQFENKLLQSHIAAGPAGTEVFLPAKGRDISAGTEVSVQAEQLEHISLVKINNIYVPAEAMSDQSKHVNDSAGCTRTDIQTSIPFENKLVSSHITADTEVILPAEGRQHVSTMKLKNIDVQDQARSDQSRQVNSLVGCSYTAGCSREDIQISAACEIIEPHTPQGNEEFLDFDSDDDVRDPNYELSEGEESDDNVAANVPNDNETPKGRKRKRNNKIWKRTIKSKARHSGEEYRTNTNRVVQRKTLKPACPHTCKHKCTTKISQHTRQQINSKFWNVEKSVDMKRQFIASSVHRAPIKRVRDRTGERQGKRQFTQQYSFEINSIKFVVCKKFYLNTHCISQPTVDTALLKKREGGIISPDKRGKHTPSNKISEEVRNGVRYHIAQFPTYESHYSRERTRKRYLGNHLNLSRMYQLYLEICKDKNLVVGDIAKEWLYTEIFNYEFNYSFKNPDNDTCDICDRSKLQLQESNSPNDRAHLQGEYEKHLADANNRYSLKSDDKNRSRNTNSEKVIMIDLQKCLPTPELHNSQSFYSLKLWTYNLTIHDSTLNKCFCMMWDESISGRGGNEVASCLAKYVLSPHFSEDIDELTIWSDNCPSQNRNSLMIMCYFWILKAKPTLKVINHKYLARGHTHLEADGDHSMIERERKKLPQFRIVTPWDWQQMIRVCSVRKPFTVINMDVIDFKDFRQLHDGVTAPYMMKKKLDDGQNFLISQVSHLQVRQENTGLLFYKTDIIDNEFCQIDLNRKCKRNILIPDILPQIRHNLKPISTKKYNHLQKLFPWIPKQFHEFYKNLPHGGEDSD